MLADGGTSAVRVEPLALRLGVSKGAFYSRYASRDALLAAMLDYWRRVAAVDVFVAFAAIVESPVNRLERVLGIPSRRPDAANRARLEMAVRIWAHHDARAAATMREIDAYRLGYIESVLKGNAFAPAEAEARAFLIYSYIIADGSLPGKRSEMTKAHIYALLSNGLVPDAGNPGS